MPELTLGLAICLMVAFVATIIALSEWRENKRRFAAYSARMAEADQRVLAANSARIEAEEKMLFAQRRMEDFWNEHCERHFYELLGPRMRQLIERVAEARPHMQVLHHDPVIQTTSEERIELVRLSMSIGLSRETPPEFVAIQIAEQLRNAILRKWQDQSLLLKGK